MGTDKFYYEIKSFNDFRQIVTKENFYEVPEDWCVVIADVKSSTKAIQQGKYKEVNMIGASCIACVVNSLEALEFPYVFGGDGASLLIPKRHIHTALESLQQLQSLSQEEFGLDLRVGHVDLKELYSQGYELSVGKYKLSDGNYLAQFKGTALTRAESLVKSEMAPAVLTLPSKESAPNLDGLSCRLSPLSSLNGVILSILIQPQKELKSEDSLKEVFGELLKIIKNDFVKVCPVHPESLKWSWIPKTIFQEMKMNSIKPYHFLKILQKGVHIFLANLSLIFNFPLGPFKPLKYKKELIINSDFRKFDETLRLVLDCSLEQAKEIEAMLDRLYREKLIYYGCFQSKEALMTCLVRSASKNRHIHFIDGANGGYAVAALGLKSQIKASIS